MSDSRGSDINKEKVVEFYDNYTERQVDTGTNRRHEVILQWTLDFGLKPTSHVLEVGCGIGTQTELIAAHTVDGKLKAVDISSESIAIAKRRCGAYEHVEVEVRDLTEEALEQKFDMILLPDVLEHIPKQLHASLFKNLCKTMHADSVIVANIPDPFYLDHVRVNQPELLQIIDQSLHVHDMLTAIEGTDLFIHHHERYDLWTDNKDAAVYVFKRKRADPIYSPIVGSSTLWQRVRGKLNRTFR